MDHQTREKIKRTVWNSGCGVVTDQTIQIIAEAVVKECSDFIRCLDNGNFYVIAEDLDEHFKNLQNSA